MTVWVPSGQLVPTHEWLERTMGQDGNRPRFIDIFLNLAISIAQRSTCQRTNSQGECMRVGCVITTPDFRKVISIGYNGNASGLPNRCDSDQPGACGCFVSGTLVSAAHVQRAYRRRYVGDVLRIVTRNGDVTLTPNHPILTLGRGWVAAEALHEGDHLLSARLGQPSIARPNNHHRMPIEDVFESVRVTGRIVRRAGARHHFHGDGIVDEDVDVVSSHHGLLVDSDPSLLEMPCNDVLSRATMVLADLRTKSKRLFGMTDRDQLTGVFQSSFDHNARNTKRSRQGISGFAAEVSIDDLIYRQRDGVSNLVSAKIFGHLAKDSSFSESLLNSSVRDADSVGKVENGFTAQISTDQILHIERYHWTGHVFNLQTESGWYSAGSGDIVSQNCIHAELNAVINCDSPRDTKKYVFVTHLPCVNCAKALINLGNVQVVFYRQDYRIQTSKQLFEAVGILCMQIGENENKVRTPGGAETGDTTQGPSGSTEGG